MGTKYCPECGEVVYAKALANYSQVEFRGIPVKRRELIHMEEDGGCGCRWYTLEVPEDILIEPK